VEIRGGLEALPKVVECIHEKGRSVVLLKGDLAAGKTTLVQAFAKELGEEGVSSPTFSIQQRYGEKIYHYDLYNAGSGKFFELGLFEELFLPGWHFIEWPDERLERFLKEAGLDFITIEIEPAGEERIYRCIV
jgi:tRNA threonylcarbamoyladenosine biosynthesis protein TsaE